jgi:hypothetical protein
MFKEKKVLKVQRKKKFKEETKVTVSTFIEEKQIMKFHI